MVTSVLYNVILGQKSWKLINSNNLIAVQQIFCGIVIVICGTVIQIIYLSSFEVSSSLIVKGLILVNFKSDL